MLTLTISDNGRGFDPAARTEGNGLLSMRRRAAANSSLNRASAAARACD